MNRADETQKLAAELAAIPPAQKRVRKIMDARKRGLKPGQKVGASRHNQNQAELSKANLEQVTAFQNWAIARLREIPKLQIIRELSRERHADGVPVLRVTENSDALAELQEMLLQAISAIRNMANTTSATDVSDAISDWKSKVESFDVTATNEAEMSLADFRAATKPEPGRTETAYLTSDGPRVLKTGRV